MAGLIRIALVLLLVLCCVLSLVLCSGDRYEMDALIVLGSYIPGTLGRDMRDMHYDVLETDDHGRQLLWYQETYTGYPEGTTFLAIAQKWEKGFVYFYEDVFFAVNPVGQKASDIDCDSEAVLVFKEQNDWNEELNPSRMTRRVVDIQMNFSINFHYPEDIEIGKTLKKSASEEIFGSRDADVLSYWVDWDNNGLLLAWWELKVDDEEKGSPYLVLFDLRDPEDKKLLAWVKIDDLSQISDDMARLKQENGWTYQTCGSDSPSAAEGSD